MSEGSTPKRIPDTPPQRRLSEQTPIASAPPFDDASTNSLLTLDDEVVPEDVSRGCVLAIFDAVAFVTACAAGALGAAHVIQLMAFVAAPAPRGGLPGAIFAASISYQFALCLCIVGFELGVISHDDQWTGRYWTVRGCVEIKILRRVRAESSRHPPRHRRDACAMAWRCRFLAARPSQDGRVITEK
jgi:hypothetical protein